MATYSSDTQDKHTSTNTHISIERRQTHVDSLNSSNKDKTRVSVLQEPVVLTAKVDSQILALDSDNPIDCRFDIRYEAQVSATRDKHSPDAENGSNSPFSNVKWSAMRQF